MQNKEYRMPTPNTADSAKNAKPPVYEEPEMVILYEGRGMAITGSDDSCGESQD